MPFCHCAKMNILLYIKIYLLTNSVLPGRLLQRQLRSYKIGRWRGENVTGLVPNALFVFMLSTNNPQQLVISVTTIQFQDGYIICPS